MSELDNNIRKLTSLIDGKFSGRAGFCNEVDQLRALLKLQLVRAENLCAVLPETYLPAAVPIPIAAPGFNAWLLGANPRVPADDSEYEEAFGETVLHGS